MYQRSRVAKPFTVLLLVGFIVLMYEVKPQDVKIGTYYESRSMYDRAAAYYEEALRFASGKDEKIEILLRLCCVYRNMGRRKEYTETVAKLYALGCCDKKLLEDVKGSSPLGNNPANKAEVSEKPGNH